MQCPSCGYENQEDAQYCNLCQYSFYKSEQSASPDGLTADIENRLAPAGAPAEKLNWLQRHLNLTWIIANIAVVPVFVILANILLFITGKPPTLFFSGDAAYPSYITILSYLMGFVATFVVGGWVLVRKNRSLWWLATLFLGPIGLIIFLCVRNKSNEPRLDDPQEMAAAVPPYPAQPSRSQPNPTQ